MLIVAEQSRPDIVRRRPPMMHRSRINPARMVFIDEAWTKINMAPLRGRSPRGQRIKAEVLLGHWQTLTVLAALCHDPRHH